MRKRVFFFEGITASALVKLIVYKILSGKNEMTGSDFQTEIFDISGHFWRPSNDTVYTTLNKMESPKFSDSGIYEEAPKTLLHSKWSDDGFDTNKRYKRLYSITDEGLKDYFVMKNKYKCILKDTVGILNICFDYIFNDVCEDTYKDAIVSPLPLSSELFQRLNVLYLLSRQKDYIYGTKIISDLNGIYNNKWKPTFGTLYPILSDLAANNMAEDIWSYKETVSLKQKSIRSYKITKKGTDLLKYYKDETDIYTQLKNTKNMYENFLNYIK